MEKSLIIIGSITYAMKGQKLLDKNGIRSIIQKAPQNLDNCGCGHGLRVNGDGIRSREILESYGIKTKQIVRVDNI